MTLACFPFAHIDLTIRHRFRAACQNAILQDFETSRSIDVETRLWDAHVKINTRFRKLLSRVSATNCWYNIAHAVT